jgi:hypothetical protein
MEGTMDKVTVYIPNSVEDENLYSEPVHQAVRVCWCGDHYKAIEGSHRALAAEKYGYPLRIEEVGEEEEIHNHDVYGLPESVSVRGILEYLYDSELLAVEVEVTEE